MGFTETQLLSVECDGCGRLCVDEDDGAKLFYDSPEQFLKSQSDFAYDEAAAEGEIYAWTVDDAKQVSCPDCRRKAHCAEHGHTPQGITWRPVDSCGVCGVELSPSRPELHLVEGGERS